MMANSLSLGGLTFRKRYFFVFVLVCILAAPGQIVSLLGIPFFVWFVLKYARLSSPRAFLLFVILYFSGFLYFIALNGVEQAAKSITFFIFLTPLIMFSFWRECKWQLDYEVSKKIVEVFIFVQVVFSFSSIIFFIFKDGFRGFDTTFGDVVAGTFRNPFVLYEDAANKSFSFVMIMVTYLYCVTYKNKANVVLVVFSAAAIFFASVTHLTLIALCALVLSRVKINGYFFVSVFLVFLTFYLYEKIQPVNYNLIVTRFEVLFSSFSSFEGVKLVGDKGLYFYNFVNDVFDSFLQFLIFGFGQGGYSSRAALLLTGGFGGFEFVSPSREMLGNTYPLMMDFLQKPLWQRGAFYFPYNGIFSLMAELGAISFIVLAYSFVKSNLIKFGVKDSVFYLSFFGGASFVDHYPEYFAPLAIFVLFCFITRCGESCEKRI